MKRRMSIFLTRALAIFFASCVCPSTPALEIDVSTFKRMELQLRNEPDRVLPTACPGTNCYHLRHNWEILRPNGGFEGDAKCKDVWYSSHGVALPDDAEKLYETGAHTQPSDASSP
jgi:hypothetical protein